MLRVLREEGLECSPKYVYARLKAAGVKTSLSSVRRILCRLTERGLAVRVRRGYYRASESIPGEVSRSGGVVPPPSKSLTSSAVSRSVAITQSNYPARRCGVHYLHLYSPRLSGFSEFRTEVDGVEVRVVFPQRSVIVRSTDPMPLATLYKVVGFIEGFTRVPIGEFEVRRLHYAVDGARRELVPEGVKLYKEVYEDYILKVYRKEDRDRLELVSSAEGLERLYDFAALAVQGHVSVVELNRAVQSLLLAVRALSERQRELYGAVISMSKMFNRLLRALERGAGRSARSGVR